MVALYVTSVEAAGKTALCAAIGKKLLGQGKKVGFVKPVHIGEADDINGYKDATFIKEALELTESVELLCPVSLPRRELEQDLADKKNDFMQEVTQAYTKISSGKDIVLVEGLGRFGVDDISTQVCCKVVEKLDAKVIVALRYSPVLTPDSIIRVNEELKQRLLGVVINFVPEPIVETVRKNMVALFEESGIRVLGVLPEVRGLLGISVAELADILGGELLTCQESASGVVESIMLGAMTPDSGIDYFSRKANKAAVIRGERADMQLAALETSTSCLILTGDSKPLSAVAHRAEDKHVPIMMVKTDTHDVVSRIEKALAAARFRHPQKLGWLDSILDRYFDFKFLYSELGLKV